MSGGVETKPVVVLGFGAAAVSAVVSLRACGYAGELVVVNDAGTVPYSPVLTSYYVGGRIDRDQCNAWADIDFRELVDELCAGARASALDCVAHEVVLEGGRVLGYSKLLIATGAHPVAPGFPQVAGSYRPHMLRTMGDAERLRTVLLAPSCKSVLVAGTSMVALKVTEACLDRGVHVTLLGRSTRILRRHAHAAVARRMEKLLVERGVTLRLQQRAVSARSDGDVAGCMVAFDDGGHECFDEVVLAQGVAPNLDFAVGSGLVAEHGLAVDAFMRTRDADVYAAGDVAQVLDLLSGQQRIAGLWRSAVQQGECAGRAMAAELAGRHPTMPYPGVIGENTIHVRDILFASAGTVEEALGRRISVRESESETCVFAYEERSGCEVLVGFNVVAVLPAHGCSVEAANRIGEYRREVMRAFVQQREELL